MSGDPSYLQKAAQDGKFNGQIATKTGPQTLPPIKNQSDLDKPQQGSKAGVLRKGK
jgi:hypothetical protein